MTALLACHSSGCTHDHSRLNPSPPPPWPTLLQSPLRVHAQEWAGQSVADKLVGLRQQLAEAGAGALLVSMLGALWWEAVGRGRWVAGVGMVIAG